MYKIVTNIGIHWQLSTAIWRKTLHQGQVLCCRCSIATEDLSRFIVRLLTSTPKLHDTTVNRLKQACPWLIRHSGRLQRANQAPPEHRLYTRVPHPCQDKPKWELNKMEKQGVIGSVREYTDWCPSFAYSVKKDGSLHTLCIDPQKLSQVLKRCPHKVPTLEEQNARFAGSTVFS